MKFIVKRDILLKSLNFVQGVVEKKNTLPILSNVLLQLKDNKLSIVATDLDIVFHDEINEVKITKEGSTTTSAAILYDILRKISSNSLELLSYSFILGGTIGNGIDRIFKGFVIDFINLNLSLIHI